MLQLSLRQTTVKYAPERKAMLSFSMGAVAREGKSLTNWGTCVPPEGRGQSDWTAAAHCILMGMWVWCSLKRN